MKTKQAFEKLNIAYMHSDFENKFYSLPFDPEKKAVLVGEKLSRNMTSEEIIEELKPDTDISMEELVGTLETMSHDVWALFYCKDVSGSLRAVRAAWFGDGWVVSARAVTDPRTWYDGRQVFSRNARDTKTFGASDTLTLDARISALEKTMEKLKKALA